MGKQALLRTCQSLLGVMSLRQVGSPMTAVKQGGVEMLASVADGRTGSCGCSQE